MPLPKVKVFIAIFAPPNLVDIPWEFASFALEFLSSDAKKGKRNVGADIHKAWADGVEFEGAGDGAEADTAQ
jgi:hypothetical protein